MIQFLLDVVRVVFLSHLSLVQFKFMIYLVCRNLTNTQGSIVASLEAVWMHYWLQYMCFIEVYEEKCIRYRNINKVLKNHPSRKSN
jgi:hypothetical protein